MRPIIGRCPKCLKPFTSALRAFNHQFLCRKSKAEKRRFHGSRNPELIFKTAATSGKE